jgi:hypothetical protein
MAVYALTGDASGSVNPAASIAAPMKKAADCKNKMQL